jgi:hypothetical protein
MPFKDEAIENSAQRPGIHLRLRQRASRDPQRGRRSRQLEAVLVPGPRTVPPFATHSFDVSILRTPTQRHMKRVAALTVRGRSIIEYRVANKQGTWALEPDMYRPFQGRYCPAYRILVFV